MTGRFLVEISGTVIVPGPWEVKFFHSGARLLSGLRIPETGQQAAVGAGNFFRSLVHVIDFGVGNMQQGVVDGAIWQAGTQNLPQNKNLSANSCSSSVIIDIACNLSSRFSHLYNIKE
jgi:hypothetical protein